MVEGQGQVAGRLEVPVESDTKGFKRKLKAKIESASKGLTAQVGIEVEGKGLRKSIQAQVDKAAAGVKVTIGIDLDAKDLRAKVEAAAKAAGGKVNVKVGTDGSLVGEVAAEAEAAEKAAPEVKVPVRAKVKEFFREILTARAAAQAAASKAPVEIPVKARVKGMRGRTLLKVGLIGSLVSLIEPAVGAIDQLLGGLTAMAGAVGPAFGGFAAVPLTIGTFVQAMVAGKIATQGLGDAMKLLEKQRQAQARGEKLSTADQEKLTQATKDLSKSQVAFLKNLLPLRKDWIKLRKAVAEPLFKPLANQIEPLADALLPRLRRGLRGTSTELGGLIRNTAKWMRTPLFGRQFSGIMRQNNRTLDSGSGALLNFAKGFTFFYRAAAPFQRRMDGVIDSFGKWFLMMSRSNARNGDTAAFLKTAGDRLSMLWNITKNLGGGLRAVFRAGDESGMRLFRDFDTFMENWREWTDSTEGQARMKRWFDAVEPGFRSIANIVRDTGKALLKWGEDPAIVGMLEQIRTEFGPALNSLLQSLGQNMGTGVIDLLTQLARTIDHLAPAIEIVGHLTSAIAGLLDVINNLADVNPDATANVAKLVGTLLLLRSGGKVLGMLGVLGKGGKAAKGGGGLLGLLGLGGGAAAGAKAAKGLEGAAASGGRLAKVLKSPIGKKAGLIGALLTVADLANDFEKDQHNYSGAADKMMGGTAKNIAAIKKEFSQGRVAEYADKLGINLDKLAESMAKGGKQGAYYKQVMADLEKKHSWAGDQAGILNPFGDTDSLRASLVIKDLKKIEEVTNRVRNAPKIDLFGNAKDVVGGAVQAAIKKAAALANAVKGLPKAVQTQIQTPGVVSSIKYVEVLRQQYDLTPKQVVTTLNASGVVKTIKDVREAQRTFHLTPKQVVTLVKANGVKPTMADVIQLHREFKLTPKQVTTLLKATGRSFATSEVNKLQAQYHLTPKQVITLLKAEDHASGLAASVRSIYAGIPRVIRTQIIASRSGRMDAQLARAGGGPVTGPGTGTSDSILARLSNGEFVIKAKSVKKYGRALFERLNDGVAAFAGGGLVSAKAQEKRAQKRYDSIKGDKAHRAEKARAKRALDAAKKRTAHAEKIAQARQERKDSLLSSVTGLIPEPDDPARAELNQNKHLVRSLSKGKTAKALTKSLDRLYTIGKRRESVDKKLADAQEKLTAATEARDSAIRGLTDAGKEYGSISSIASANGGFASPSFLIGELTRRLGDTSGFRSMLDQLRAKGLGQAAYEQITSLGIEQGSQLAKQLLGAGADQIAKINQLQTALTSTATGIGQDTANAFYQAGVNSAQGLVNGLESQAAALKATATRLASSLVTAIKKKLKIHSPSRVTMDLGDFTGQGLGLGLERSGKGVLRNARALSARLTQELTPDLSQLRGAGVRAGSVASLRSAAQTAAYGVSKSPVAAQRLAPLVEHLTIQGKTEEETADALDQMLYALRRIRQGGVYADRTAG